ncbi:hypothetical protein FOPG_19916 [Fusarium oxysporum f. sp. conglutinans race 2 54008]|nr:hypothetical protein FOPG_19916 [Fusarium oxysporum f. sp. conglutinans race 2 54008]
MTSTSTRTAAIVTVVQMTQTAYIIGMERARPLDGHRSASKISSSSLTHNISH